MTCAGGDVIACGRKRAYWTGSQAPAAGAGFARTRDCGRFGHGERLAKAERAAVRMPQPIALMDQKADRRGMDRLGAARPLLERPERRPAKGEQRFRAEFARETPDHPLAPAVERMGGAVSGFGAFSKRIPTVASGET